MRLVYSQAQICQATHATKLIGDSTHLFILLELINFGDKSFNELNQMTATNPVTLSKKLNTLKAGGCSASKSHVFENYYYAANKERGT